MSSVLIADLPTLLLEMRPVLNPGTFVFASVPGDGRVPHADIVASIREPEALSVIIEESAAKWVGLSPAFKCAWITLMVRSDLHAVGLTAEVAAALANAGIGCNVVAGVSHDHIFVPVAQAAAAMGVLTSLTAPAHGAGVVSRGAAKLLPKA